MRFRTLAEWLAWQETLHRRTIDLGLDRVARVFKTMGRMGTRLFTITVGGTNGKGSCVALLEAILRSAGYRVGTYTSPHLLRYNERIRIDGRPVDDDAICEAFVRIDRARGDTTLSFFEFGTLAALDIFSAADLDVQLLEVGMGGRLDAVNIIDADAALLASIDIDHQAWLGSTRELIGLEKAGIFRPGRTAVIGDPDVPAGVLRFADAHGIALSRIGHEFGYEAGGDSWTWQDSEKTLRDLPFPPIPGEHQLRNAAAVLETLHRVAATRPVSEAAIREGLRRLHLAGRFQRIGGEVEVLLDVAHNPGAAQVLAEQLRRHYPARRIHAVFSVMRDKDIAGILDAVGDLVHRWYIAPLAMPRAASTEELSKIFRERGVGSVENEFSNCGEAFARAHRNGENGDLILIFGSFFLVAEYLAHNTHPRDMPNG